MIFEGLMERGFIMMIMIIMINLRFIYCINRFSILSSIKLLMANG